MRKALAVMLVGGSLTMGVSAAFASSKNDAVDNHRDFTDQAQTTVFVAPATGTPNAVIPQAASAGVLDRNHEGR